MVHNHTESEILENEFNKTFFSSDIYHQGGYTIYLLGDCSLNSELWFEMQWQTAVHIDLLWFFDELYLHNF